MVAVNYKKSARGKSQYIGVVEIDRDAWSGCSGAYEAPGSAFIRGSSRSDLAVAVRTSVCGDQAPV